MQRADTYLLYGATDTGKTAQLGEIAQWEFARTGRVSRLISADSGWDPIEHMVIAEDRDLGFQNPDGSVVCIEAWNVQGLRDPWAPLIELSEGAWPEIITSPVGPRLRMKKATWGKDGFPVTASGHVIGQYLLEGLSTLATTGMQDHINNARKLSQEVSFAFQSQIPEADASGKEAARAVTLAGASMSHFGQVQRFLLDDLVPRFGKLPVDRVVWTSHEARGRDDMNEIEPGKGSGALGPATVGKAMVDKTTLKFGHSFHMTVETILGKDSKGIEIVKSREFRAWFVSHPDSYLTKMNWPAKVSLPIARSRELLAKFPGGFIPLTNASLTQFLEFLHTGQDGQAGSAKP